MLTLLKHGRTALALLALLTGAVPVWASSGNFVLSGEGITLGEPREVHENGKPQPPRYHAKVELGQPFTLTAQGIVYPRGGKEQPAEPERGAWQFDDAAFKVLPHDQPKADKTRVTVRLQPTAVGTTRVRFVGQILGYERTFDVFVEVVAPKKK